MNNLPVQTSVSHEFPITAETKRQLRILVVEDEEAIRDFINFALADEGYEVVTATDGQNALELLSGTSTTQPRFRPDLILLDMRMPRMDGWTFSQAYHSLNLEEAGETGKARHAPILVMTAASDAARFAGQIKSIGYVAKPFDLEELLRLVKRFTHLNQTSNE